ncbi:MAG: inosine/xanthosine triphosphatase [Candidatus Aenigmatarchaeota archaeon]|nr:MAG: inosine/xanthosine triphosphatase [Candidatus Aenigmarchaeota archaeon]
MAKILVGSKNPVKITSVEEGFLKFFKDVEVIGIDVDSGVPDQPINNEIFKGAKNRALELKKKNELKNLEGDFFVGLEGGITEIHSKWFNYMVVYIIDNKDQTGISMSDHFELPKIIVEKLLNGGELGPVIDELIGDSNIKQKSGAIGFFTKDILNRKDLCRSGVITALIPFINKGLYFGE